MSSVISYVALFIGVIGILVIIGFSLRNRKARTPIWYYRTRIVIDSEDISIHFREQLVNRVSVTKLGFVNLGKEPIPNWGVRKPITTYFVDDTISILKEPKILSYSSSGIDFKAALKDKYIHLSFDFLNQLDGAVIEITHTGDEKSKMKLDGDILGVQEIKERSHRYALNKKKEHLLTAMILWGSAIYITWTVITETISDVSHDVASIGTTIFSALMLVFILYGSVMSTLSWKRSLPKKLSI